MSIRYIFLINIFAVASLAQAKDAHELRFEGAVAGLRVLEKISTALEGAEQLAANVEDAYRSSQRIRATVALYTGLRPTKDFEFQLREIADAAGRLENSLEQVERAQRFVAATRKRGRSVVEAERRLREAKAALADVLRTDRWLSGARVDEIETFSRSFRRPSVNDDFQASLRQITKSLKELVETRYDHHVLGVGGLDTLRRNLDRFLTEAHASGGTLLFRSASCPISSENGLLNSWYAQQPQFQFRPLTVHVKGCPVSQCLVLSLAKAAQELREFNATVEFEKNVLADSSDEVPRRLWPTADALIAFGYNRIGAAAKLLEEVRPCEKLRH